MNENIKKFVEKAIEDKQIQERMAACKTPEEAYAVASSVQEGFTMEEFVKAMQQLYDATHESELTKEDMAKAAGGLTKEEKEFLAFASIFSTVVASASATGALAGAAV